MISRHLRVERPCTDSTSDFIVISRGPVPLVPGDHRCNCDPGHSWVPTGFRRVGGLDPHQPTDPLGSALMSDPTFTTAVVTGASRGFGRAIAAALVASGTPVVGIARDEQALDAVRDELGAAFTPIAADATDETLAQDVIREHRPDLLVLNAGVAPHMAPVHEQTWETFSRNWHVDTKHAFVWTRAALRAPLAPGSVVVSMSSGAALRGSPGSGGYASAKAAIRFLRGYGAGVAEKDGLDIRFVTLMPLLTPTTALGSAGVAGYAAMQGVDEDTFVANLGPILTPDGVGKAVLAIAEDPDSAAEYEIGGTGTRPLD
jgi:NADP-dependent 3-hydroxy acid dehydrogenase YdfG